MRQLGEVPGLVLATASLAFAGLVYTPAAVLAWPSSWPSLPVLGRAGRAGRGEHALAFVAFFALIREVGTSRAMVFTSVNPAVAVAAGVLACTSPLTASILAGFGLIIGGSLLATGDTAGDTGRPGRRHVDRPGAAVTAVTWDYGRGWCVKPPETAPARQNSCRRPAGSPAGAPTVLPLAATRDLT